MITVACGSCQSVVFWARTERNRAMLVDAEPHPEGNLEVTVHDGAVQCRVLREGEGLGLKRYRSHFATCPDAGQHRRKQ